MEKNNETFIEMCCCGWIGNDFENHHNETVFDNNVHVETSPLMQFALNHK